MKNESDHTDLRGIENKQLTQVKLSTLLKNSIKNNEILFEIHKEVTTKN